MSKEDEEYVYFIRKLKPYWGTKRYEYVMHPTIGRARASAKSSIKQGGIHLEPQTIIRVAKSAMEEIEVVE